MTTLTPTTPTSLQGKAWKRYAKDAAWSVSAETFTYTPSPKSPLEGWTAAIGHEDGQIAKCMLVSGRFGTEQGNIILLDHYVFVDHAGRQVGRAIRRSMEGLDPNAAFWGLPEVRGFLNTNGIALGTKIFGSARELEATFPGIIDQCPTLQPRRKLLGVIPV